MARAITLYHNPRCSKSRETLQLLLDHGVKPRIVLYLETPPDAATLAQLAGKLGFTSVRQLMRRNEEKYEALGLDNPSLSEEALIAALVAHPKLIERPIAIIDDRACIGRPPQRVVEMLC